MNVRRFHGGAVDSVVLDGNDCGFSTINSERHVESIAVPVVENAEKPIRGTTAVTRRPRFQSMHEHALHDIVIVNDEPSGLPPVAVRPPHAHDSGYDGDDRRSPSRPITNSNGRKHENDSKENPMNNQIQPFEFEGNKVRALADGDEVMFVASDIAKILGYRDAANLTRNLDGDERDTHEVSTPSGTQNMTVLTESGLYRAILNRETAYVKNEEAQAFVKRFQRWVTHEVLPSIRRTGGYIPTSESDSDKDIMARAVLVAQKTIKQKNQQIASQQTRIDELQPKASAWDNFVDIDDALSVRDSAKLLSNLGRHVGQTELFEWLDRHDWIFRENKHWSARQSRINAGHLMMVPSKSHGTHKDGTPFAFPPTVKVTRKGLALIARRFGEETLQLEYPKAGA